MMNQRRTRREFMELAGVGGAGLVGKYFLGADLRGSDDADLVVGGSTVYSA